MQCRSLFNRHVRKKQRLRFRCQSADLLPSLWPRALPPPVEAAAALVLGQFHSCQSKIMHDHELKKATN
jgi:hypothetical protein